MSKFYIDLDSSSNAVADLDSCARQVSQLTGRIDSVLSTLPMNSDSMSIVRGKIQSISTSCVNQKNKISKLSTGLNRCVKAYQSSEKSIAGHKETFSLGKIGNDGAFVKLKTEGSTYVNGVQIGGAASVAALGYEYSHEAGIGIKTDEDGNIDEIGAHAGIKGEAYLGKAEASGNIGAFSGSIDATVGKVEAKGEVKASLVEDGKIRPSIGVAAGIGGAVAAGSAHVQAGDDQYNVHADASGSVAEAKADAGVNAGVITYEDKNGKEHTEVGVKAEAKAEAYLAEGKVSGGFTVCGIKVDVGVSGKAGGAGVGAEGHVTTGRVGGSIALGLGLGAGLDIDIDFSNVKLPKLWW